jgi:hypothetical protein
MAEPKTKPTTESVAAFLSRVADDERRSDCKTIVRLMKAATGAAPRMWGTSIVGFGNAPVVYADGRTMDWPAVACSPRKGDLTLYVKLGRDGQAALLKKLGKHKAGKGCLYIKRLADVDLAVLEKIIAGAAKPPKAKLGRA